MRMFILLLFVYVSILSAAPTLNECREELAKARECGQNVPGKIWKIVSKEEFDNNSFFFNTYNECLGEPKCDINKGTKKLNMVKWEILGKMSDIYSCVGNDVYDKIKTLCSIKTRGTDCSDNAFYDCTISGLEKSSNCSPLDVEKFKELVTPIKQMCSMKKEHRTKFANFGRE